MSKRLGAAIFFVVVVGIFLAVQSAQGQPAATPVNLIACPWFRQDIPPYGTVLTLCEDWTRNNNIGLLQANGIPSPDSLDGTAFRVTRDYTYSDESKLWQIVQAAPGLRLRFSVFYQIPPHGDLTITIYGRDSRYGIGGWVPLLISVDEPTGDNVWQYVQKEVTLKRPYGFYMVEILSHAPGEIGATGTALTGVHLSIDGGVIYLPMITGAAD